MEIGKKTILIQSVEYDVSTHDVLDWLYYYKNSMHFNIKRVNGKIIIRDLQMFISNNSHFCSLFNYEKLTFWYRRGEFKIDPSQSDFAETVKVDYDFYNEVLDFYLPTGINKPKDNEINKLKVYHLARKLGLKFPETHILNEISDEFISRIKVKDFVVKSLCTPITILTFKGFKIAMSSSTVLLKFEDILKSPKKFLLSQFQEYIHKKYEIRTFYLNGIFKSMAIFSQQNSKTKIDFRNYDKERPNRCVPYMLPKSYEKKLHKLMVLLEINCGSIDTIVTPNDDLYFLEVNPIGQFNWLSKNCNYFIERLIANTLISKND